MKKKLKITALMLVICMLAAGCGTGSADRAGSKSTADRNASAAHFNVERTTSGISAARVINGISDDSQYRAALREALDSYYSSRPADELTDFTAHLDSRGTEIAANYAAAYKERAAADKLSYAAGQVLAVSESGAAGSTLKEAAAEENGSCSRIVSMGSGQKVAVIKTSLEDTVDSAVSKLESADGIAYAQPNYKYSLTSDTSAAGTGAGSSAAYDSSSNAAAGSGSSNKSSAAAADTDNSKSGSGTAAGTDISKSGSEAASAAGTAAADSSGTPEDKDYPNDSKVDNVLLWHLYGTYGVNALEAWNQLRELDPLKKLQGVRENSKPVKVGVVDTGIDASNDDFNFLNEDKNGTVTALARYENGRKLTPNGDDFGHGTHVCGILGAATDNGNKISSITYNQIKLYSVDASTGSGYFMSIDMCLAVKALISQGVDIINMSVGGPGMDPLLQDNIKTAYNKGIVVITASGNESTSALTSPADSPYCIGVNASNRNGEFDSAYSNYGYDKDITAPGTDIWSTFKGNTIASMDGTSMASPLVSGIAALIIQAANESSVSLGTGPALVRNVRNILYNSTSETPESTGFSSNTAFGIVNAARAVTDAKKMTAAKEPVKSLHLNRTSGTVYTGNTLSLEYKVTPVNVNSAVGSCSSSNAAVASVDSSGTVTGKKPGTAVISLNVGGTVRTCTVTVKKKFVKISTSAWSKKNRISQSDPVSTSITAGPASETVNTYCDGYCFYAKKGRRIRICMQASYIDSHLKLFNKNGKCVKKNDDISKKNKDAYISYKIPSSGYYYLEAASIPGDFTFGSYRLSVMSSSKKVSSLKMKSSAGGSAAIKWKKAGSASNLKYRVYIYDRYKKYQGSRYVSKTSYKKTGLYTGQKLYFKVRPYLSTSKGRLYGKKSGYVNAVSK